MFIVAVVPQLACTKVQFCDCARKKADTTPQALLPFTYSRFVICNCVFTNLQNKHKKDGGTYLGWEGRAEEEHTRRLHRRRLYPLRPSPLADTRRAWPSAHGRRAPSTLDCRTCPPRLSRKSYIMPYTLPVLSPSTVISCPTQPPC